MISLAFQQLRSRWQRSLAVFIAVVLGVGFFTIALLAGGPLNQSLREGVGQQIHGADLVISRNSDVLSNSDLEAVRSVEGVDSADFASFGAANLDAGGTRSYVLISEVPTVPHVRDNIELETGEWPQNQGEITLSGVKMEESALSIGDDIAVYSWATEQTTSFRIVGVFESPSGLAFGRANAFVSTEDYQELLPIPYRYAMRVQLDADANRNTTLQSIQSTLGPEYSVLTFNEYVDLEVDQFAGSTVAIQSVLGAFAAIAMVASGIVIANSFEISIAQRMREIGLLRTVGATNRQIRRLVIIEALLIGVIASVVGLLLGISVMSVGGLLFWGGDSLGLEITLLSILGPFALGVLATVVSAFGPARNAMRVRPLQAIRQSDAPVTTESASRKRLLLAGTLFVLGTTIMALAGMQAMNGGAESGMPLLIGIAGGGLTFLAVLISAQLILPLVARFLGSIANRVLGITAELATGNLARTPRRTASAAAALLMGVTLMTMMTVGASSVKSTIVTEVHDRQPIDLQIRIDSGSHEAIDLEREVARWQSIPGVSVLTELYSTELELGDLGTQSVVAVDPNQARGVLRSDAASEFTDDTIVVTGDFAEINGLSEGDSIQVGGPDSQTLLQVQIRRMGINEPAISTGTMRSLAGEETLSGVWIRLESEAGVSDVVSEIRTGLPASLELDVSGGAAERESTLDVLDTMLLVVIGLLAAAVVIAIVGIGNTLTLSVVERTRESGMLRAMGLKRGQVRRMLALEGVAISLIGTLVGLLLGIAYGIASVLTLFGDSLNVTYSVPWGQLGLIGLVAIIAGLLASVLPARRALSVKPVEALSNLD